MLRTIVAAMFIGFIGSGVFAQDFDKGLKAAQDGDYATALREWQPLAEQGNTDAQTNLGLMYYNGNGVLKDLVTAHMWFNIAAVTGSERAKENRGIVEKTMTREQIAEATRMAKICMASDYADCE